MNVPGQHTQVLIIGAGPSGLMMAAQLLRNGIQPVIIDSKQGPTNHSKALAVQARSLEIYRQMGIVDTVIKNGGHALGLNFHQNGKKVASLAIGDIGKGSTPFPYVLIYQQSKNERVLLDYLTQNCCPVYWDTKLISAKQTENQVEVQLSNAEGSYNLTCDWLIGADGPHSETRGQLHIPFTGDTYPHLFYLADVVLDNDLGMYINIHLSKKGFAGFFPMPEKNNYRIIGSLPESLNGKEDITLQDVIPDIKNVSGLDLQTTQCNWFTTYHLHHRMADKFRVGNCFLIGDAAHIHSPVGGQGMNTGLQDAYNLAWKLAGVINKQINNSILDSYAFERMPIAKELLKTTDRAFNIVMSQNIFARIFKRWLMPRVLNTVWGNIKLREAFFLRVSQTGISYRESKINLHLSHATKIKAGDRLPYLKVYDEKKQVETDLHEWCSKPGFTFIALGKLTETALFNLAKWITKTYPYNLNFFYLPPSNKNRHVFDAFEMKADQHKTLIIRPDMHIGFINDAVDIAMIDNYLVNIVGCMKVY